MAGVAQAAAVHGLAALWRAAVYLKIQGEHVYASTWEGVFQQIDGLCGVGEGEEGGTGEWMTSQ